MKSIELNKTDFKAMTEDCMAVEATVGEARRLFDLIEDDALAAAIDKAQGDAASLGFAALPSGEVVSVEATASSYVILKIVG